MSDLIVLLSMRFSIASYAVFAVHVTWRILLKNHISVTSISFCSCFQSVQALHPYISRGSTLLYAALLLMWMKMHKFVIIDFHLWKHNCLSYCGYFSGVLVWYKSSQYLHWLLCLPFYIIDKGFGRWTLSRQTTITSVYLLFYSKPLLLGQCLMIVSSLLLFVK